MFWVMIVLLVVMATSLLLDLVDGHSEGNRNASLVIRGISIFVCMIAVLDKYAG